MLGYLHNEIAKIIDIEGLSKNFDGTIDVQYKEQPNQIQLEKINQLIQNFPLEQKKQEKLKQIEAEWIALEQTGWDSGQGFNLGIASSDVALLVGVFSLAKEAAAMGLPIPSIIAMNNSVVNFSTIDEMTLLLLRYGAARSQMSEDFAAKRRAVEAATTIEEVESI